MNNKEKEKSMCTSFNIILLINVAKTSDFCLLKLSSVGFDISLEFIDCGLDGSTLIVPIKDGFFCTFNIVFSCELGAFLMLDDGVLLPDCWP